MLKRPISAEQVVTCHRDGIVCLRGMFDVAVVEMLREAAEQCTAAEAADLTMEIARMRGR